MLSKSLMKSLVGFDDGSHAVKYYSEDTWKILTSRNYRFLDSTDILPSITSGKDHQRKGKGNPETISNTGTHEIPIT